MKGYKVDTKKKKIELVDDGLPFPDYPPYQEPEGVDLNKIKEFLTKINSDKVKKLIEFAEQEGWI